MFVAWLITISLFLICIYATYIIIEGVKQKDQYDLENFQLQFQNIGTKETTLNKRVG